MSVTAPPFLFSSQEGFAIVREVIAGSPLGYTPHDYQIEGVCKVLDGANLIAVLPTSGGKTGYYTMYMLVLLVLSQNSQYQDRARCSVPADPCMVMVYPTNGLEEEQVCSSYAQSHLDSMYAHISLRLLSSNVPGSKHLSSMRSPHLEHVGQGRISGL